MSVPALLQLPEFSDAPKSQLGSLGVAFGKLYDQGIPLPAMIAVPTELLQYIAQTNNLLPAVSKLLKKKQSASEFAVALDTLFRTQRLPKSISTQLVKLYHSYCKNSFVSLFPAEPLSKTNLALRNLKGEAVLQEAVLELWSKTVQQHSLHTLKNSVTLEKLAPVGLLIQQQPPATASGSGFTRHPLTGDKTTLLVQATWGETPTPLATGEGDSFEIDAHTYQVTRKNIRTKPTYQQQTPGGTTSKQLPEKKQTAASLTAKQLERLARLLNHLRQKKLHHFRLDWVLDNETLYCINCTELGAVSTHPSVTGRTMTKLYANVHGAQSLTPETLTLLDGVGVLRLEYTYAQFGMHPLAALTNTYHRLLAKELTTTIEAVLKQVGTLPVVVRSQDFTSDQLRELSRASTVEPLEPNPYLGLRGGLKALSQPQWLRFELEVLAKLQKKTGAELSVILPFVRTPTELARLCQVVQEYLPQETTKKTLWLELATPAAVFSLAEFPLKDIAGVILNLEKVGGLFAGFDPTNPDISLQYQVTLGHLELFLKHTVAGIAQASDAQNLKTKPLVRLQLDRYNPQFVAAGVQFGVEGVVVQPKVLSLAKTHILEAEAITAKKK